MSSRSLLLLLLVGLVGLASAQISKDLLKAIEGNNPSQVNMALKSMAKIMVDTVDDDGDTALMLAVRKGKYKAVKALLKGKADAGIPDATGFSLMHVAATAPNADRVLQVLLPAGLDPNTAHEADGLKPLHRAVLSGSTDAAKTLLNAGVPADEPTADGKTAIDLLTDSADVPNLQKLAMYEVLKKFDRPKEEL